MSNLYRWRIEEKANNWAIGISSSYLWHPFPCSRVNPQIALQLHYCQITLLLSHLFAGKSSRRFIASINHIVQRNFFSDTWTRALFKLSTYTKISCLFLFLSFFVTKQVICFGIIVLLVIIILTIMTNHRQMACTCLKRKSTSPS